MSRSRKPAVDAALSAHWQRAVSERRAFEIGLIVGQTSAAGVADALLTGVPVPSESEDEEARSFDDISIDWVQEYAKQIDRLLPGGISVIGLYVVSAAPARAVFDDATFYLRAVVEALRVPKAFALANNAANGVHYVVHVCPNSNKTSAKSVFDLLDAAKSDAIPAELKSVAPSSSDALLSLKKFMTTVAIDELIAFDVDSLEQGAAAADEMTEKMLDAVQQQLLPLVQRVQSATGILRNRRAANSSGTIDVQLISAAPAATMASTDDDNKPRRAGRFRGAISCVAYVLANAPNAQEAAVAYLKQDFVKSLLLRVELIREKYADEDAAASSTSSPCALRDGGDVAFPKRATLPWSSSTGLCPHFPALLHVFQEDDGETASNEQELVVQNALEILGALDSSSDISASLAFLESASHRGQQNKNKMTKVATPRSASTASASTASATASATSQPITSSNLFVALAVLLVLLAIVAQQLL